MGNQKFRLTNIIPNVLFYKLKDMNNKTSKINNAVIITSSSLKKPPRSSAPVPAPSSPPLLEPQCQARKSYHITRELNIDDLNKSSPRKSKSSSKTKKSSRTNSISPSCSCQSMSTTRSSRSPPSPVLHNKETDVVQVADNVGFLVEDDLLNNSKQIILASNNNNNALAKEGNNNPEHYYIDNNTFKLPPRIITKQETQHKKPEKRKPYSLKEQKKLSITSPRGMKLRVNSPKITGRKQGQNGHKNVNRKNPSSKKRDAITESSFAVVKSSFDPQRDFKESMVEMIVQNNLRDTKDLEDLLACYLTLNSDEYHHLIINVFKQIWFDFRHLH